MPREHTRTGSRTSQQEEEEEWAVGKGKVGVQQRVVAINWLFTLPPGF
jgi:hypothetical protein